MQAQQDIYQMAIVTLLHNTMDITLLVHPNQKPLWQLEQSLQRTPHREEIGCGWKFLGCPFHESPTLRVSYGIPRYNSTALLHKLPLGVWRLCVDPKLRLTGDGTKILGMSYLYAVKLISSRPDVLS